MKKTSTIIFSEFLSVFYHPFSIFCMRVEAQTKPDIVWKHRLSWFLHESLK